MVSDRVFVLRAVLGLKAGDYRLPFDAAWRQLKLVRRVSAVIIALLAIIAQTKAQAAMEDALGVQIAKLCRELVQASEPIAEGLADNGFVLAEGDALDAIARHMSYRRRLERAAGSTYVPDPESFPAELEKARATLDNLNKISFISVLIHPDHPNYFLNAQEKGTRSCGFTYVGDFTGWPERLGFTSDNSISFEERFASGQDLSVKILHGPKDKASDLGTLVVLGPSLCAGSNFGGSDFAIRWSVSP